MPENEHLAVVRVHAVERFLDVDFQLRPHRRVAGRAQLPEQMFGQRQRRHLRQRPTVQRHFLPRVAHPGVQMPAMHVRELLADFHAEPQKEGHARVSNVLGELAAHRQVGLLHDVRGIDAALEPPVHAQPDHALETVAVALDQDGQGALVAVAGGVQQAVVGWGVGAHGGVPIPLHGNAGRTFTPLQEDSNVAAEGFQAPARQGRGRQEP